jgi:hypothetical protein
VWGLPAGERKNRRAAGRLEALDRDQDWTGGSGGREVAKVRKEQMLLPLAAAAWRLPLSYQSNIKRKLNYTKWRIWPISA